MTTFHSAHRDAFTQGADVPVSSHSESPAPAPAYSPPPCSGESLGHHVAVDAEPVAEVGPEFYQAAVAHAEIPIIPLDGRGRMLAWNNAARQFFGRNEGEVVGRPLAMLIPPEFRQVAAEAFGRTIQQRSVNTYEMTVLAEGGKHAIHVGVTLSCVIDGAGAIKGVTAWMRDISNRKELEDHLTRTRHMASVGTLAAGVAHHFNNIACGMGTMVEFALATEEPLAMLKALKMSKEACTRIRYITQSLLACSGDAHAGAVGRAGQDPGEIDYSDLTEEILGFVDAVEPTLNQKGIALELELGAGRVTSVPRVRFGQLLQHLLHNAADAIEERSGTTIGAERRLTLRTQSQGGQFLFQFVDTGCGIEAEDLRHIFDPFFTRKGVSGGGNRSNPGLGLTLVQSVVLELGGGIWADSTPGQGTTLNILVPIRNE